MERDTLATRGLTTIMTSEAADTVVHAFVVIVCVITAGIVDVLTHQISPTLGNVLLGAIGFAAGRSGVGGKRFRVNGNGDR